MEIMIDEIINSVEIEHTNNYIIVVNMYKTQGVFAMFQAKALSWPEQDMTLFAYYQISNSDNIIKMVFDMFAKRSLTNEFIDLHKAFYCFTNGIAIRKNSFLLEIAIEKFIKHHKEKLENVASIEGLVKKYPEFQGYNKELLNYVLHSSKEVK